MPGTGQGLCWCQEVSLGLQEGGAIQEPGLSLCGFLLPFSGASNAPSSIVSGHGEARQGPCKGSAAQPGSVLSQPFPSGAKASAVAPRSPACY